MAEFGKAGTVKSSGFILRFLFISFKFVSNNKNMSEQATTTKEDIKPNIDPALFAAWQLAKQNGDVNLLMKETGLSRPVIDNALLRGYVVKEGLAEKITGFFENRQKEQKAAAVRLLTEIAADTKPKKAKAE